jgi:2-octaprenyl-6-methoxyphenol hydroxylase
MSRAFDAAVVGGGLAGRAAALAVAQAGLTTLHLAPAGPPDRRTSALMQPAVAYLQRLGVLADPPDFGDPLTRIRVIDATGRLVRAPETLFDSAEAGLEAFGWNLANAALAERSEAVAAGLPGLTTEPQVARRIEVGTGGAAHRLTLADGEVVEAALLVGADGKGSPVRVAAGIAVREHAFRQAALVADLELGRPLAGTSVEFHYEQGPFTLVPAGGRRANLVWIDDRAVLEAARAAGPQALARTCEAKAHHLFGAIDLTGPAVVFPLSTLAVARAGARGAVLVGEAAHAFPPIGAQGLNLGLRDVAALAKALATVDRGQPGWAEAVSTDYARRRAADLARTGAMVDALFRSLLTDMLPAQLLRAGGLWALNLLPGLRRQAFAVGMGR